VIFKKVYRDSNFWFPFYFNFKQVKECGGLVFRREKGFPFVFWKLVGKEGKDGSIDRVN
tara:strand:- start:938 stop:1114 length:177 start_codon:yes stop_codon:yes gene_type:complete